MCFSAVGSFSLSGVLAAIGTTSVARSGSPSRRLFAALPLLFAAQQAAEGAVWLTIGAPAHAAFHRLAVNAFLGVALIVWPVWSPLSLQRMERDPAARRALRILTWFGLAVAVVAIVVQTMWPPVAVIAGHSISYKRPWASTTLIDNGFLLAYGIATIVPFFVSTTAWVRAIGALLVASLAVTFVVERDTLTSVWCFFAAILSGLILVAVSRPERVTAGALPVGP